jgi:hypothetical protein
MIGEENTNSSGSLHCYEIILSNFRSHNNCFNDAKDQVLIAVIMRYICDRILNCRYSVWLAKDHKDLLYDIEESTKELEPKKGKSQHLVVMHPC